MGMKTLHASFSVVSLKAAKPPLVRVLRGGGFVLAQRRQRSWPGPLQV